MTVVQSMDMEAVVVNQQEVSMALAIGGLVAAIGEPGVMKVVPTVDILKINI